MGGGPGLKHPAKVFVLLALVCALLAFVLSLIAVFVPWSWKDTAVFERTTITLWQNCVEYTNRPLNEFRCEDNDLDQIGSVAGGDEKCRGYFVATQVFTIAAVCFSFLALILCALLLGKLWSKPIALAFYAALMAFFAFSCCLVGFLMWIVYAEQNCQPGNPLFPVVGYSWGWICLIVATFFAFLAMLLAYLALLKILTFKPFIPHEEPPLHPVMMEAPVYSQPEPYLQPVAYEYTQMPAAQQFTTTSYLPAAPAFAQPAYPTLGYY